MTLIVSFLRGINVGGNKKIRMAELKAVYESLGFTNVQTLLQSGNVVFESESSDAAHVAGQIEAAIVDHFGFESKVIIRTGDQLKAVVADHPFSDDQLAEPSKILIAFLKSDPGAEMVETLRQAYTGPEIIYHRGSELYIYYPDGMGRSKLDNSLGERKLKTTSTGRNWNTVNKLLALAGKDA